MGGLGSGDRRQPARRRGDADTDHRRAPARQPRQHAPPARRRAFVNAGLFAKDRPMIDWIHSDGLVPYDEALAFMEDRVAAIHAGTANEAIWFLEHPPLYTAGTSARIEDLTDPDRFPVHVARRGGEYTYHGPGQRVVYVMLDLTKRGRDVRKFVQQLEAWMIAALGSFNVTGHIRDGRVGVWVERPDRPALPSGAVAEDKVAAIGIRLRKWISFHGMSINVDPDLSHFDGIVPCGITDYGVTSLVDLGLPVTMEDLDVALRREFDAIFPEPADAQPAI
ncbi:MAG: lipoyl(octanoyl) transferase LipB [Marinibacterium sp.]|nr:lipoyl(octanoyl) transferase LipB [Marinibacterium sp.]